ncbi:PhzF family phenazine biosynthesis protein [Streptomyces sp. HM190]|uniref:PhzF family phenazine biosynthesis protein n=1 Tax=Streptomyces sp. HM190 TaxID=2695266 RepID=UPI00135B034F|nr:PhzF family phenazine biosynthesis isomerase [Streptomyces sp. HM190]
MDIFIVDAFTDRAFSGNPAGVVLLKSGFPGDEWLRDVAAEVNLSETAFLHPLPPAESGDRPTADWALRWFTPVAEVSLCGHATLAAAHVLARTGRDADTVRFASRSGVLTARTGSDGSVTLDFPASLAVQAAVPDGLAGVLGAPPVSVWDTGELGDLLVELSDERTVRELAPDQAGLARLGGRGVIVTAEADETASGRYDFVSRYFAPAYGVPEDPVTGSAHTALAPWWAQRLGRGELTGLQLSARRGTVATRMSGDRVLLTGWATIVVSGKLHVEPRY